MKREASDFMIPAHPVVMLVHNALELTKRSIESVMNQDIPVTLIVVNNASNHETTEYLNGLAYVQTQTFKKSIGVSGGWNYALTNVFRKWDHCLVVNNDVELRPDTYRTLLNDDGQFVTAVSVGDPKQLEWDGQIRRRNHPDFSCFLVRKSVWETVGGFDESMVLYASDADYHLRMHKAGIEAYTIGIPFFHYASGTLKSAPEVERMRINHQADADRERFKAKWGCSVGSKQYYEMFGSEAP